MEKFYTKEKIAGEFDIFQVKIMRHTLKFTRFLKYMLNDISFFSFNFQLAVLFEVLIPLVLFLILMGIRLRRQPEPKPEGK